MTVVSWNAKVGRSDARVVRALRKIDRAYQPEVILLQEAGAYVDAIRRELGKRWYVYAQPGWPESQHCPILVRKRGHRRKHLADGTWGTIRMETPWVGPHGGRHPGRTWTWVRVEGRVLLSLHRVTGGRRKNREAYLEEASALKWLFGANLDRPVIVLGDTNTRFRQVYPGSMRAVADQVSGFLVADRPAGVDYGLVRGVTATASRVGAYGSDHRAVVMRGVL